MKVSQLSVLVTPIPAQAPAQHQQGRMFRAHVPPLIAERTQLWLDRPHIVAIADLLRNPRIFIEPGATGVRVLHLHDQELAPNAIRASRYSHAQTLDIFSGLVEFSPRASSYLYSLLTATESDAADERENDGEPLVACVVGEALGDLSSLLDIAVYEKLPLVLEREMPVECALPDLDPNDNWS